MYNRKRAIKRLDDLVRKICRLRDLVCGACGRYNDEMSQVSHYIGRRHYALRWDLRNCNLQHAGCNIIHNNNPAPYSLWMISKYGSEILVEFEDIKNKHTRMSNTQLQIIEDQLKEKLNEYT